MIGETFISNNKPDTSILSASCFILSSSKVFLTCSSIIKLSNPTSINPTKSKLSQNEQLEYILQAFPNIGPKKSKNLLKKFKTLKNIFNENEINLKPILNKNSYKFISLLNSKYG
jgi:ERCC4-type nuclease